MISSFALPSGVARPWQTLEKQFPSRVKLIEWDAATKNLSVLNGVVYKPDKSEDFFIQEAVQHMCSVVRPPPRYMVSHLTGCERLTHEVETLFQEIPSSHFEAQAIGLHGTGGLGKTTICKLMVNHYAGVYVGRCALIEFPTSDHCPEAHILNQCRNALQQLTNISKGRISSVDDLDQCLQLFNDRVKGLDVFIAIDNIWEKYLWFAQRILDVGFSQRSKILATSRSGPVLTSLLKDSRSVRPLPSPNREEAHQIFIRSFNRNHFGDLHLEQSDVDGMSSFFYFSHQYHPLAINAVGTFLGKMDRQAWPTTRDEMHRFLQHNDNLGINRVIRLNYDSIPNIRREMFLDVAVIYIPTQPDNLINIYLWSADEDMGIDPCLLLWLTALYKGRMEEWEIRNTLIQLTFDGLLEFDIGTGGCEEVRVHDLYTDLAIEEGAANGKVSVYRGILSDKDIKCAEVARIVEHQMNILRTQPLPNLQLLMTTDSDCRGWRLELIPEVRILKVRNADLESDGMDCCLIKFWRKYDLMGWENIPHLSWLELRGVTCEDISKLSGLRVLQLRSCSILSTCCTEFCLSRLVNLQVLKIHSIDIGEITGLDTLVNLKSVTLAHLPYLFEVGNFSAQMTQLQYLAIKHCGWLKEVRGVGLLPNIKSLRCARDWLHEDPLIFSQALKYLALDNVREAQSKFRDMPALFFLHLTFQGGSVVEIHGLPRLEQLKLLGEVKEIATISQLPSLEIISVFKCKGLEEIEWSSFHGLSNLREIEISFCDDLQIVKGDPSGISHTLPHLVIKYCEKLEEVAGLDLFTSKYLGAGNLFTDVEHA